MRAGRFDLPLDRSAGSRFMVWIVTALVFASVVLLGIAAIADGALRRYDMRANLVTVTIPSPEDWNRSEQDLHAVLNVLQKDRGIAAAHPVSQTEIEELIKPWLGDLRAGEELPLPRLIDVILDPAAKPDLPALQDKLREVVPGASIGVEAMSRDRAERLAALFRTWGGIGGVAVLLGSLVAAAAITRLNLAIHGDAIGLLRSMGAPDAYVARQYERHALSNAMRGGLLGFALAAVILLGLIHGNDALAPAEAEQVGLRTVDWILLACVPVVSALLITAVARLIALRALAHMP